MNKEKLYRASGHIVTHVASGKRHFFDVKSSATGETHHVDLQVGCDCKYMGIQGIANADICSHILAVLKWIARTGEIQQNETKKNK